MNLLISACLVGVPCQYNGRPAPNALDPAWVAKLPCCLVPVCPEQLAGLPTPREPAEIQGGDGTDVLQGTASVRTQDGQDYTDRFRQAAETVLRIARVCRAEGMITQLRSPSCSSTGVYDGSFSHRLRPGMGVCAAHLRLHGLNLTDAEEFVRRQA